MVPNAIKVKGGTAPPICQMLLEPARDEISRLVQAGYLTARQRDQSAPPAPPPARLGSAPARLLVGVVARAQCA